jgi:hypothetical protein
MSGDIIRWRKIIKERLKYGILRTFQLYDHFITLPIYYNAFIDFGGNYNNSSELI